MKKNAPLIGFLSAFGVMLLAFIIYFLFLAKKNEYLLDNPTSKTFYFKINNGDEKIITAGQYVKVDLNRGKKNEIKVFDEQKCLVDATVQRRLSRHIEDFLNFASNVV